MSPVPTRPQIEAIVALPTYTIEIDQGVGYAAVTNANVRAINTRLETTNDVDNAFAFGTIATTQATIDITDNQSIPNWQRARVRISYGFDTSDKVVAFEGIIVKRQHQRRFFIYECESYSYTIERRKVYSNVFYRRPIATKTTNISIEDPTDDNYFGGLLNYIMWYSGGRPYEQFATYENDEDFVFWYSFDESIVKPRWSWISGENSWEEAYLLVRAAGGQLYQDVDGVLYYKQPLTFGYVDEEAELYHFTESTYVNITEESSTIENMDTVICSFVDRVLQPMQQVYESTTPRLIPDLETIEIEIEMQYPIYEYGKHINSIDIKTEGPIKATFLDGRDATPDIDWDITVMEQSAQKIVLEIYNHSGEPISLNKITIQGRPITAGSEGVVRYTGEIS